MDWSDWRAWLQRVAWTDWAAGPRPGTPWERFPRAGGISLTVRSWEEDDPGDRAREHLAASWPSVRQWWRDSANARPTAEQAGARLEEHMPELVPAWKRLACLLEGDPEAAAALALWNPPPFLTGCSQAAVLAGGPALIRNYDWDYRLFDGVVARTAYTGHRVLGMLDRGRSCRPAGHGVPGSGPASPHHRPGRGHQPPGQGRMGTERGGDPQRRAPAASRAAARRRHRRIRRRRGVPAAPAVRHPLRSGVSGPCTPPITGRARGWCVTAGRTAPWSGRWSGSSPAISRLSWAFLQPGYRVCASVRSRWLNPPGARAWRRADVCTVMSLACRTGHPARAAVATSAWSSAVRNDLDPPAAR